MQTTHFVFCERIVVSPSPQALVTKKNEIKENYNKALEQKRNQAKEIEELEAILKSGKTYFNYILRLCDLFL